ncbi:hypothetical protein K440DRAFT_615315 [Wilcoxina mikolae CBS 423.85]|nr:hypothetical protein K440DRAFT_615315 [Wilcoxina mikolae CBS 423.85]
MTSQWFPLPDFVDRHPVSLWTELRFRCRIDLQALKNLDESALWASWCECGLPLEVQSTRHYASCTRHISRAILGLLASTSAFYFYTAGTSGRKVFSYALPVVHPVVRLRYMDNYSVCTIHTCTDLEIAYTLSCHFCSSNTCVASEFRLLQKEQLM